MSDKSLGDGQVATSSTVVYTVPESVSSTTLTYLALFNTNAADQTIAIYIQRHGSTSRQVGRFVLKQNQRGHEFIDAEPFLSPGDKVLLSTTTASAVDYMLSGTENA